MRKEKHLRVYSRLPVQSLEFASNKGWLKISTLLSFMNNDFTVNNTQKVIKIPLKMNQNS